MSSEFVAWLIAWAALVGMAVAVRLCRDWRLLFEEQAARAERDRVKLETLIESEAGEMFALSRSGRAVVLLVKSTAIVDEVPGDAAAN